jgi:hypothetical protein
MEEAGAGAGETEATKIGAARAVAGLCFNLRSKVLAIKSFMIAENGMVAHSGNTKKAQSGELRRTRGKRAQVG